MPQVVIRPQRALRAIFPSLQAVAVHQVMCWFPIIHTFITILKTNYKYYNFRAPIFFVDFYNFFFLSFFSIHINHLPFIIFNQDAIPRAIKNRNKTKSRPKKEYPDTCPCSTSCFTFFNFGFG